MKKLILLFILFVVTAFVGCGKNLKNNLPINKIDRQILLIEHNKERNLKKIKSLSIDKKLCDYAQNHAEKMAAMNYLYHSSMSGLTKIKNSDVVGENIAWGQETEKEVVSSWMWSPGHRWNILSKDYNYVGFGFKDDSDGRVYWCVVFSE